MRAAGAWGRGAGSTWRLPMVAGRGLRGHRRAPRPVPCLYRRRDAATNHGRATPFALGDPPVRHVRHVRPGSRTDGSHRHDDGRAEWPGAHGADHGRPIWAFRGLDQVAGVWRAKASRRGLCRVPDKQRHAHGPGVSGADAPAGQSRGGLLPRRLPAIPWHVSAPGSSPDPLRRPVAYHDADTPPRGLEMLRPSIGLAEALHLRDAVLLGPGTDPSQPDLGPGKGPVVAYVGATNRADGFGLLLDAMTIVRERCPDARLDLVGALLPPAKACRTTFGRSDPGARALANPARGPGVRHPAADQRLLQPGRPDQAVGLPEPWQAGRGDPGHGNGRHPASERRRHRHGRYAAGLAEGLLRVLTDDAEAAAMSARARAFACAPESTWDARARTVLRTLGLVGQDQAIVGPHSHG